MGEVDVEALVAAVACALEHAEPFAAVPMFTGLVQWLDAPGGVGLVAKIAGCAHPSTWGFDDAQLDLWAPPVVDRALAALRALPSGEVRIEGLGQVPRRLTRAEHSSARCPTRIGRRGSGLEGRRSTWRSAPAATWIG